MTTPFKCILADPPWAETGGGKICRGAQKHYQVVKDSDIVGVIKESPLWIPDEDCHLWLWVTNNRLPLGLKVMNDLGFDYKTNMVWVKDRFGIGQYLRGQHEILLFGTKGKKMYPPIRNVPSVVIAKRNRHSEKPQKVFELIERVSPAPRAELFSRQQRPGWNCWGNEVKGNMDEQVFFWEQK